MNEVKSLIGAGNANLTAILSKVIGLIGPGQDAVEDAKLFIPELGAATNSDMDASQAGLKGMFSNFTPEDQRDYEAIEEGVIAIARKIARAKKEGIAEGRAAVISEIKAGEIDVKTLK